MCFLYAYLFTPAPEVTRAKGGNFDMIIDFNDHNRPVIIGLDHGYGNMKTAHTCFQTGVTRHDRGTDF